MRKALVLVGVLAAFGASACNAATSAGDAKETKAAAPFDFQLVKPLVEQKFAGDPGCGYGEWATNKTGIEQPYAAQAKEIWQFDCYESQGSGLPNAGQQAVFVTFGNEADAAAYVQAGSTQAYQAVGYLRQGAAVLETHQGYPHLDRLALLKSAQSACSCGTLTPTPLATGPTPGYVPK